MVIRGKLLVKQEEVGGYIVYVFENLNSTNYTDRYVMCTQCPNWQTGPIAIGAVGFLTYDEHIAGVDKWFDGNQMNTYRYNMIQFMNFIEEPKNNLDGTITL